MKRAVCLKRGLDMVYPFKFELTLPLYSKQIVTRQVWGVVFCKLVLWGAIICIGIVCFMVALISVFHVVNLSW